MKVLYTGQNVYQQFDNVSDTPIIEKFTPLKSNDIITHFCLSFSFNVIVSKEKLLVKGFINGKLGTIELDITNIGNIVQVCTNNKLILILTNNGDIFKINVETIPIVLQAVPHFLNTDTINQYNAHEQDFIIKIDCGETMTIALSKNGKVYNIPSMLNTNNLDVKDIACGREHALLLTKDGSIFTWGIGSRGQLGHGNLENEINPRLVEALNGINIKQISAGGWHTAVLSEDGDLYTWGWNVHCQLGFNNNNIEQSIFSKLQCKSFKNKKRKFEENENESISVNALPKVVDFNNNLDIFITKVACGNFHTIVMTANYKIFGVGWNKYCQLGQKRQQSEHTNKMSLSAFPEIDLNTNLEILGGPLNSAILIYS